MKSSPNFSGNSLQQKLRKLFVKEIEILLHDCSAALRLEARLSMLKYCFAMQRALYRVEIGFEKHVAGASSLIVSCG
jgi:hypothetical protein